MNRFAARLACALVLVLACTGQAWSALACSMSPVSLTNNVYSTASNLDLQGTFTISCTRANNDRKTGSLWLGLSHIAGDTLANPYPDTLAIDLYRDAARSGRWTMGAAATGSSAGGLLIDYDFERGNVLAITLSATVYVRIPSAQLNKAAGSYERTFTAHLREDTDAGRELTTSTVTVQATVPGTCTFAAAPVAFNVTYAAFRSTALTSTATVDLSCNKGTRYTLTFDSGNGVVPGVELAYGIGFSPASASTLNNQMGATGSAAHGLTLTLPPNQAGNCSAASCTGSGTRTITISY